MQQVYCRTLKQKCDFNKVALQLYFSQFFKNTLRWLLLGWEKSKLAQVTQLVSVSIMLLLYTLSEEGNVQLISMYVGFFPCIFICDLIIEECTFSLYLKITLCGVFLKLNDIFKGVSTVYFALSAFPYLGVNAPKNWLKLLVQWWIVKPYKGKPVYISGKTKLEINWFKLFLFLVLFDNLLFSV